MRKRTWLAAAALTPALVAAAATPALAEGNGTTVNAYNQFRPERFGVGTSNSWQTVPKDSPLDTNTRALVTTVATDPDPGDATYYYADAYTRAGLNLNKPAGQMKNLSFDFDNTRAFSAGSLRISVIFTNGEVAYLSASTCNSPLAVRPSWSRADFTGATLSTGGPCGFDVTGANFGGHYDNTATQSAWQVFTAAHPQAVVEYDFLVMDQPGTYVTDRIALGTNWLYNFSNLRGYRCNGDENRC